VHEVASLQSLTALTDSAEHCWYWEEDGTVLGHLQSQRCTRYQKKCTPRESSEDVEDVDATLQKC
jgi:hypothetical protein